MADFRSTLLTLPDDAFFELIRNYLGPIRTPFNKHDLITRLMAFIRNDETQDRIIAMIDEKDAEILTTVWLLDEPSHEDLFAFLEPDHSFLELHSRLLNLEDRLLLYHDEDRIRINPELAERLLAAVIHPARLFHGAATSTDRKRRTVDDAGSPPEVSWLNDTVLISLFSFLLEAPELYRADGELRKRSSAALEERIPLVLDAMTPQETTRRLRIDFLVEALTGLALTVEENAHVRPIVHNWHRWARVSPLTRLAQLAGAGATSMEGERPDAILAAEALVAAMPQGVALQPDSVARLAAAATGVPAQIAAKTIAGMTGLGLFRSTPDGLVRAWHEEPAGETKPLVIQANFELTLPAEIPFADALFVAEVCELLRHDRYPRFELTKDRVATAMRAGIGAAHIADRLSELARGHLPQNVAISLRSWEEEFESIRLYRGVVLQIAPGRRHAVEHSPAIGQLIIQELAPGTYLLDESDVPALQRGLREAGVELIPELPPDDSVASVPWKDTSGLTGVSGRARRVAQLVTEATSRPAPDLARGTRLQEELAAALEKRSLQADQRQELAARIQRKLILSDDQLQSGALKTEKTEAKGLDYAGKVRMIEQSLGSGGYLEVIERTAEGSPRRRLVEPAQLRKEGTELILEGYELPARTPVELPVSKLGLVRRLRAALFRRASTD